MRRRQRHARSGARRLRTLRNVSLIAVTVATVLLGAGFSSLGAVYLQAAANLPDVSTLATIMGPSGQEAHRPARLFDRSGQVLLFELIHPLAAERRWVRLESLPEGVAAATVAALDPDFWSNAGYAPGALQESLVAVLRGTPVDLSSETLTQRLVNQTLTSAADLQRPIQARAFRSVLLASQAARRYSKEQILEWFLNTADYGNLAFGIDAASLVYLGKHAEALTPAEAALLAGLPADPAANPVDDPTAAATHRESVLDRMREAGWLTQGQAADAGAESITVRTEEVRRGLDGLGFVGYAWSELRSRLGPGLALQGGLTVITTLDVNLQLQTDCVLRTQIRRLAGGEPTVVESAADGSACVAAGLLPLPRPGGAGKDSAAMRAAAIVLDSTNGEILAVSGPALEARPAGSALAPLIYLTAFAKGYTPATMVVDAPASGSQAEGDFHGPVRMRVALANGYAAAMSRTLDLSGTLTVARTARQMGLTSVDPAEEADLEGLRAGTLPVSLADLSFTYVAMANNGLVTGAGAVGVAEGVVPYLLRSVVGPDGTALYAAQPRAQAVLSPPLAYLLENILSDDSARWATYGQGSALEIGRAAGVYSGAAPDATDSWTIGFTPSRVVGVRVGSLEAEPIESLQAANTSTPIWHALMRYAVRDLPPQGWEPPAGVEIVEVCDPSGYLPTPYCPNVVREVFVAGTEPTHPDSLYQPYLVNRETGKLATLFTPAELVEERVYFVPPPEAEAWARQAGIEPPPTDYDSYAAPPPNPDVRVVEPEAFGLIRGVVNIRGTAQGTDFDVYRVRYGRGLNPREWIQVGDDGLRPVQEQTLARWDTSDLDGLFTLQLMVVRGDGTIEATYVPVTIDNQAPHVRLVIPEAGTRFPSIEGSAILLQAEVEDAVGVIRVDFFVDGVRVQTVDSQPWSARWPLGKAGEHRLTARATDRAGNVGVSEDVVVVVEE
jgi:membrane peptidoglycan carboxypeptidase